MKALLGGTRGYADPLLLILLWVLIASAGAWSYVETKRTKAIEQSGDLEPRSSDPEVLQVVDFDDSALGPPRGVGGHQDGPQCRELFEPGPDAELHEEPLRPPDVLD